MTRSTDDFAGRVALVTGAYRGIGLAVSRQLARLGFEVVLTARDLRKAEAAAGALTKEGLKVVPLCLDVTDAASVEAAARFVSDEFGRLDVLVNNAAILYDDWQGAANANLETAREAFETNTLGPWRVTLGLLPLLRQSEHPRVVNVSSESGSLASMGGGTPAYSVSKAGLNVLTRKFAAELRDVLVNSVCPGWVATLPDEGPTGGFFRDGEPLPW